MNSVHPEFQEIFDAEGNCLGAILGSDAWLLVRDKILAKYQATLSVASEVPEPMQDWNDLVQYWDFKYPCSICGNETVDWQRDEPRKFYLTAANLGGLVTFKCLGCNSKIMKRHFKDSIKVEAKPFVPEKTARNLGRPE